MAQNRFLDNRWQKAHLKRLKEQAGNRYTPELNVNLPISEIFDGISRTENFYISIRKHYGKLNREFGRVSKKYENNTAQKLYQNLKGEILVLLKTLDKLKEYDTKKIPWDKVNRRTKQANKILWELSDKLREEKDKAEKQKSEEQQNDYRSASERFDSDIHYLYETQKELRFFEEFSSSTKAKLSNKPLLLLTGAAGTGKTHLLCDLVEGRFIGGQLPGVLLFGESFGSTNSPWECVLAQLDPQKNLNKNSLLKLLNQAGRKSRSRAILIIDALNESKSAKKYWRKYLSGLINDIQKYPHIAFIVSVRNGYEDIIPQYIKKKLVFEEHHGYSEDVIWDALQYYFNSYNIRFPEIPLLHPEFYNPLFLKFFCKKNRNSTPNLKGGNALKDVFEDFVIEVGLEVLKKITSKAKRRNNGKNILWDYIVKDIALWMAENGDSRIPHDNLHEIVKKYTDSNIKSAKEIVFLMERRGLLLKFEWDSRILYKFTYNKFSDHIIVRTILSSIKPKQKRIESFKKDNKIGKSITKYKYDHGILEALCIQTPEFCDGKELFELAPYLLDNNNFEYPFRESIVWRDPKSIGQKVLNLLAVSLKKGDDFFLDPILSLAPFPENPLNADFLHKHLSRFSMPKRDSWWSTFLHYQYGERGAVDRLVEWGWSDQDKSHINDESIRLCAVALAWFLTTPNRFLRDKATKALVALLTNRLSVVLQLLKQFKDVNDPYVSERLYAVAYGCAIRSRSDKRGLKALSKWVYDEIFKRGNPPVNILLRDYARGVIEVALYGKINIQISRKKIEPPCSSDWPKRVPSEKSLKNKYYPEDFFQKKTEDRGFLDIWSSVMYNAGTLGDFGNYVLNSAVDHWSGRRLNGKEINRKNLFNDFKNGLTKRQKESLEKATNPFFGVDISNILASIKYVSPNESEKIDENKIKQQEKDQKKEMKKAYANFRNSLSEEKKKFFDKEIKPFLDDRGNISDPLERFDTGLAQRWVFNRVVQLGWEQKLHGQFDKHVNYNRVDRSEHKPERIGKKYQWIALHELLARISDNFEFKEESWSDNIGKYEGPWQLSVRDIDPSCTLKEFPNTKPEHVPNFKWEVQSQYNAWYKNSSHSKWLKKTRDLPDPKKIIEFIDDRGIAWVALEGFVEWQEETPPEQEKYNLPMRRLWYMIKSYLVQAVDKDKVFKWAKQQHFMGRWMPESHEFYHVYLGEYPWAPAFLYHYIPYYHHDGWTDGARDKKIPAKILVTDDQYLSSGSSIDCSTNEAISVKLPAKFIVDGMNLTQKYIDGRFFDRSGELVAFDPSVFDEEAPRNVLIRKDKLNDFLKRKGYAIFWTLLGEKNIIGGGGIGQPLGWLEIDGAYSLNGQEKVMGVKRSRFKKSK